MALGQLIPHPFATSRELSSSAGSCKLLESPTDSRLRARLQFSIPLRICRRSTIKSMKIDGAMFSDRKSGDIVIGDDSFIDPKSQLLNVDDSFSIIESPETTVGYEKMQLEELRDNIKSRRNKIFLLMEEVRRLRIQQRLKGVELGLDEDEENDIPEYASLFPFLPPLTSTTLKLYYATCFALCGGIILFGGLLAPILKLKLGIGFTSYTDFIHQMHLPIQLSQVDPIVASFSGGAVGVISSLMVVEANNIRQQDKQRCKYCHGTGYLACAICSATGCVTTRESLGHRKCPNCFGVTKVMCPTCLCTGMALATEHDPRIDPFD